MQTALLPEFSATIAVTGDPPPRAGRAATGTPAVRRRPGCAAGLRLVRKEQGAGAAAHDLRGPGAAVRARAGAGGRPRAALRRLDGYFNRS